MTDSSSILDILSMVAKRYRNYYLFEQISDEEYAIAVKVIEDICDEVDYER